MKVLITGAAGNLGRCAIPKFEADGCQLLLADSRPVESRHESVILDVRDANSVLQAAEGCDAIVHAAALHGIHLRHWKPSDFWSINVTGTFNVFEAAKAHGIKKLVLCSTMGVYGGGIRAEEGSWSYCDETLPLLPKDVYGMSKLLCEEMARTYGREWGVSTVALRLGMFVPEGTFERYGFRLLFGGVDDRDVAQALTAAMAYNPSEGFEAFNIMADVPFTRADLQDLHRDLGSVLSRYFPDSSRVLAARGIMPSEQIWWPVMWSTELAQERMGYRPKFGFGRFLEALDSGNSNYYPELGIPWWGV